MTNLKSYKIIEECQGFILLVITIPPDWHTGGGSGPTVRHHRTTDQCKQADCMLLLSNIVMVGYWRASRYPVQSGPTGRLVNPQPKLCLRSGWFQMNSPYALLGTSLVALPPLSCCLLEWSTCKICFTKTRQSTWHHVSSTEEQDHPDYWREMPVSCTSKWLHIYCLSSSLLFLTAMGY